MPKMKAYASFDFYLKDQPKQNQVVIRALRRFVQRVAPDLVEAVKWGNGCWLKDGKPVAYVYAAAEYTQFGFMYGAQLDDPRGLLDGEAAYVRHIKVRKPKDIDEPAFSALLRQAVARSGGGRPR
ncbi:MAG: DUF1801 domain-containing protein [Planctomycetota bacterium]